MKQIFAYACVRKNLNFHEHPRSKLLLPLCVRFYEADSIADEREFGLSCDTRSNVTIVSSMVEA